VHCLSRPKAKSNQPTQLSYQHEIEMAINLKLAKALDLIVSLVLLGRADEMIE